LNKQIKFLKWFLVLAGVVFLLVLPNCGGGGGGGGTGGSGANPSPQPSPAQVTADSGVDYLNEGDYVNA
jgi:hypothetical protein